MHNHTIISIFCFGLKLLWRSFKGGTLTLILLTTLIAITNASFFRYFNITIEKNIKKTTQEVFGADAIITRDEPINQAIIQEANKLNIKTAETITFLTMLSHQEQFILSNIKAVSTNYPNAPTPHTIALEPRLLLLLNAKIGDTITIGYANLVIKQLITEDPITSQYDIAPKAMINLLDLPATKTIQAGSRATFSLLLQGSKEILDNFKTKISNLLVNGHTYRAITEQNIAINNIMTHLFNYINLGLLASLIFSAIVIAIAIKHYCVKEKHHIALLRTLGASSHELLIIYLTAMLFLALLIGTLGSIFGYVLHILISHVFLPAITHEFSLAILAFDIIFACVMLCGFSLPYIIELINTPPVIILRGEVLMKNKNLFFLLFFTVALALLLYLTVSNIKLLCYFIGVLLILLALSYWLISITLKSLNYCHGLLKLIAQYLMHNILNLSLELAALAGTLTIAILLFTSKDQLLLSWQSQIKSDAPNYFITNINQDEVVDVHKYLQNNQLISSTLYPVVRARLIQGMKADAAINRALNLTYTNILPSDNKILSGTWFQSNQTAKDSNNLPVSIESNFATRLGVNLNDKLIFQIGEHTITSYITSIRSVRWDNFQPNFYFIFPADALVDFPKTYIASIYVSPNNIAKLNHLITLFPALSIIDINKFLHIAAKVASIAILIIKILWLALLTSSVLLYCTILWNNQTKRIKDFSIMRALGATNRDLLFILGFEFAVLGLLATIMSIIVSINISKVIFNKIFNLIYIFHPLQFIIIAMIVILMTIIIGILLSLKPLRVTPIRVLQGKI